MNKIRYFFEWQCYPFWDEKGTNIGVQELPISVELRTIIIELDDFYQNLLDLNDPNGSGFVNEVDAAVFAKKSIESASMLKTELKDKYEIIFNDRPWKMILANYENNKN